MGRRMALAFATLSSSCIFLTKLKEMWGRGPPQNEELHISFLKAQMEVP